MFKNISTVRLSFFIREVKNHLNYEHRVFNSEEFLKTRALGDQQFYKQVRGAWACVRVCTPSFALFCASDTFHIRVSSICEYFILCFSFSRSLSLGPADPLPSSYFLNWLFRVIYV